MKRLLPLLILFAILLPTIALAQPPRQQTPAEDQAQYDQAIKVWTRLKTKCEGNYSYTVSFSSWVGFGNETTIVVRDNKVVERKYREWSGRQVMTPVAPGQTPPEPEEKTWSETGEEIGENKKGAPAKTLDELYEEAAEILKRDRESFERYYVRTNDEGLLTSCFYIDTRVMDDAPRHGLAIGKIELVIPEEEEEEREE
jgi:hypothetical protein